MSEQAHQVRAAGHDLEPSLELHIEELVVEGLLAIDGMQLRTVVQQELTRLFEDHGVPAHLTHAHEITPSEIVRIDGGEFTTAPEMNTQAVGAQIAASVYKGLNP